MVDTATSERVARGVEILNREQPGWLSRVDLTRLEMNNPALCVVGQTLGNDRYYREFIFGLADEITTGRCGPALLAEFGALHAQIESNESMLWWNPTAIDNKVAGTLYGFDLVTTESGAWADLTAQWVATITHLREQIVAVSV